MNNQNNVTIAGKSVLITGGLGFIGSNLARRCLDLGARVSIYDNLDPNSGGNLYNVEGIRKEVEINFYSLLNIDLLGECISKHDFIFNCAASTSHAYSMREPWADLDINSRGVVNLLDSIRRYNPKARLVHIGTSTQLGPLRYKPANEDHPEFPTDIYSANKSVSEKYVLIYARVFGIAATVIRLANVFGPRAAIHTPELTFNNYFIGLALQGKDITVFGDGKQLRNVMYVDDAVEALILAAESEDTNGMTFFAVGDEHYSVSQIAELTVKHIGRGQVAYVNWPSDRRAIEIGDAIISNQLIKQVLNWSPKHSIRDGMLKTRDYFENCLEQYLR